VCKKPRIFGPKRNKVTREWRRLHTGKLKGLYSSPNIVSVIKLRRMTWSGHIVCMGKRRGVYRILVGKPEGKKPLIRSRHRQEDTFKNDLQEVGCGGIGLDQSGAGRDRWQALVNVVMNLRVP
jgi:hypothetical protein